MTTMLDKCAVAGDITQGIDRRGVWTAAITIIGGTSNTAVKLVSSDTVNGEYTDYKTLISAADADTDQYKGFVVDLHGAKKYIKVTGAVMATAVFGDCDHDVKNIAITEGEVPSGAVLENNHEVTITENGEIKITPSAGKDGMKKVTATVNVTPALETKVITAQEITNGGEITPENPNVGFDKITFPNSILEDEVTLTQNGTTKFGTGSRPTFPKKVIVNVPSDFIAEYVNVRPSDDPIVLDCTGKTYAVLSTGATSANGTGISTPVNNGNSFSVNISSAGQTAGTVAWDGTNKTLTYTPNASYPMGSVTIWKVLV